MHLPVELLTGSTKTAKRSCIQAQLESGELPLLVGTHALIQDKVNFNKLGLVVSVLEQSQDGFFISEMDMRLRGEGEVLGTRQSGLSDLVLANLVEDEEILVIARTAAISILAIDPKLKNHPHIIRAELARRGYLEDV